MPSKRIVLSSLLHPILLMVHIGYLHIFCSRPTYNIDAQAFLPQFYCVFLEHYCLFLILFNLINFMVQGLVMLVCRQLFCHYLPFLCSMTQTVVRRKPQHYFLMGIHEPWLIFPDHLICDPLIQILLIFTDAEREERKRRRKSRWGNDEKEKSFILGMPTVLPTNLSKEQEEAYLCKYR